MLDKTTEAKITDLIGKMTLEEKVSLCHGAGVFKNAGVKRLGIPPIVMSDGTCGVRRDFGDTDWSTTNLSYNKVTYMPADTALAATWNSKRAFAAGRVLGREARGRGKDMILAPGINIMRDPLCGRNYEYMGEDPYLVSQMAAPFIEGIQKEGVAACVKHFAMNNQETERLSVNVEADERALREIYMPGFKAAVQKAKAFAVMGAYNKFRGRHCCHSPYLLNDILKGEWKFDGVVVSDWGAVHDTKEAANAGLDIEMNVTTDFDNYYFAKKLIDSVKSGEVAETTIDDKVRRILRLQYKIGAFSENRPSGCFNLPKHREEALKTARESVVLLKNERGLLPLDLKKLTNVLVVGANADRFNAPATAEGDSGDICALYEITPLTGIMMRLGGNTHVDYEKGYGSGSENDALYKRACEKARTAQTVIFVGGLDRSFDCEGKDRESIDLPYGQDKLISGLLDANPNTVVVMVSGSPVGMSRWIQKAPCVLQSFYSGSEGGYALAQILFGDYSASGKLPFTIPYETQDSPDKKLGKKAGGTLCYDEGVFVGYRYYDTYGVKPLFCFGHGLSYTSFRYGRIFAKVRHSKSNLKIKLEAEIENCGKKEGAEVVQLYVAPKSSSVSRPAQELRGFQKVFLDSGEKKQVGFNLDRTAFCYFDSSENRWVCEQGDYEIRLCASSRDVRSVLDIHISETFRFM